jgi:5-hydroxyisourate hydrolase-like protein (transthyretin family)
VLLAAAAVVAANLVGCGSGSSRLPTYPVHGEISCGGKPAVGVGVYLLRADGKTVPEMPMNPRAVTGPDGRFAFTTYDKDDGAPEGEYVVTLHWAAPKRESTEDRLRGMFEKNKITASVKPSNDNVLPPIKLPTVDAAGKPLDLRPPVD